MSITAGTVFHGTRTPLATWFRAAWWLSCQKHGTSALGMQRVLGLGSYKTAWMLLHRLRRSMVRAERTPLEGPVEVDETFVGGVHEGFRGRSLARKALVVIAVEVRGEGEGRVRLRRGAGSSAEDLVSFVEAVTAPGSEIVTDGHPAYLGLGERGFRHGRRIQRGSPEPHSLLPHVHRIASLLKRWLLGTHQGAVSRKHLDAYLEEFTFRFNRRTSTYRGQLFVRLIENAVRVGPVTYRAVVGPQNTRGVRRRSQR